MTLHPKTVSGWVFTADEIDRIIHVMECGREVLAKDVEIFRESAAASPDPTKQAMESMAEQFGEYVTEADHLLRKIIGLRYDAQLAFVSFDRTPAEVVAELADEDD